VAGQRRQPGAEYDAGVVSTKQVAGALGWAAERRLQPRVAAPEPKSAGMGPGVAD